MRKAILLILLLAVTSTGYSQRYSRDWVGLGLGVNQSNLNFKNSAGEQDESIKGVSAFYASFFYSYALGKKKRKTTLYDMPGNLLMVEIGYKRSQLQDSDNPTIKEWNLSHLSSSIGFRHKPRARNRVAPYFGLGLVMDYLLSSVQHLGVQQFDVKDELKDINLGIMGETGLYYSINYDVIGTLGLSYTHGLSDLESGLQQSNLSSIKIGLGIHFLIGN